MGPIDPYGALFQKIERESDELRLSVRKELIWPFSWAVPNKTAIELLAQNTPLVELGAGTGYWAWLIAQAGGIVSAYDCAPDQPPHWINVTKGNIGAVHRHHDSTLFLCWPPYQGSMAADALAAYQGRKVIYIGEFRGRTADERFHSRLESGFKLECEVSIPQWPGYTDKLFVFVR